MPTGNPDTQPVVEFNISAIPIVHRDVARMILAAFAKAGFGGSQQLAALANAIAESALNPNARSAPPNEGVGLFQINRTVGLGIGQTAAELEDPANNINLILSAAQKSQEFVGAASLQDAVSAFVHKVIRPADPAGETIRRLKIAENLVKTA